MLFGVKPSDVLLSMRGRDAPAFQSKTPALSRALNRLRDHALVVGSG